jgi:hypothetical protein
VRISHAEYVLEALTGVGLATSAGLNAYIPLLTVGVLDRYTGLIDLPPSWQWLGNGWVIGILTALLAVEFVADKVPVVDHVNDVIQTFVRPTAGGLAFGAASSSETVMVTDPGEFFTSHQWVPVALGIVISLTVHAGKAAVRPVVNATTVGVGTPVVSTAEDVGSVTLSLVAIIVPILVLVFLVAMLIGFWMLLRRRQRRRNEKRTASSFT